MKKLNRDDEKKGGLTLALLFFSCCLVFTTSTPWRGNRKGIDAVALVSSNVSKTKKAGNVALKKKTFGSRLLGNINWRTKWIKNRN